MYSEMEVPGEESDFHGRMVLKAWKKSEDITVLKSFLFLFGAWCSLTHKADSWQH